MSAYPKDFEDAANKLRVADDALLILQGQFDQARQMLQEASKVRAQRRADLVAMVEAAAKARIA